MKSYLDLKLGDIVDLLDGKRKLIAIDNRKSRNQFKCAFESDELNTKLCKSYYKDNMVILKGYENCTMWSWIENNFVDECLWRDENKTCLYK